MTATIQELIQEHNTAQAERQMAEKAELDSYLQQVLEQTMADCKVWLGELWTTLEPGTPSIENYGGVCRFELPLSIQGEPATLSREVWRNRTIPMGHAHLKCLGKELGLPVDKEGRPFSPHRENWGRFFVQVEEARGQRNRKRASDLLFNIERAFNEQNLEDLLASAQAEVPDAHDWEALASQRREELAEEQAERQATIERNRLLDQQHEAGVAAAQKRAAESWHPFIVYAIVHASDSSCPQAHSELEFSVTSEPDADGWWPVVRRGEILYMRFPHIVRIERRLVLDPEDNTGTRHATCSETMEYGVRIVVPPARARRVLPEDLE